DSTGCTSPHAMRPAARRGSRRTPAPPGARTPSTSGGSGSAAPVRERYPSGRGGEGAAAARGRASRCGTPREARGIDELAERGLDAWLATLAGERAGVGARDEDEVVCVGELRRQRPEGLAQHPLHPVALDRPADLPPDRDAKPRIAAAVRSREGVEHQVAGRVGAALAVDAIEVGAPRQPAAPAA